ncbi:fatty acid-binding protein 2-like [Manduca sexta]|uniref:fatty acid-binding protein 2-like n=1 Tax=Manduca sexta TaxID=7130 RepID=UPI0011845072|nr:fatty acid-binding protein 2-like [Manduca sexta]
MSLYYKVRITIGKVQSNNLIAMAFLGKEYKFVRDENFEAFIQSLGLPEEENKIYKDYHPSQKLTLDGATYTFTAATPQSSDTLSFKSGVEFDEKIDHSNAKSTVTVEDNVMTHVQKLEDGKVFTFLREFNGDELVLTITNNAWDGATKIYYKA